MNKLENIRYSDKHAETLDVYLPDRTDFRTIVYFHGGGLEAGDKAKANMAEVAERMCALGYGVVSANYRMYPTARFPDFLVDAADAVAYATEYMSLTPQEGFVWGVIRTAMSSVADLCVIPMQDILNLGEEARMNFPGTMSDSNWTWRIQDDYAKGNLAQRIYQLTKLYGRASH